MSARAREWFCYVDHLHILGVSLLHMPANLFKKNVFITANFIILYTACPLLIITVIIL